MEKSNKLTQTHRKKAKINTIIMIKNERTQKTKLRRK